MALLQLQLHHSSSCSVSSSVLRLLPLLFFTHKNLYSSSPSQPRTTTALKTSLRPARASQLRSCFTEPVVVQKDEKYGNKQIISVTPQIYDYILSNVREPEILRKLREETATMRGSQMQVSPDQAQLLAMLVQIHAAQRCIEVGVFTGYSSLAIAMVLPESGRLVACERDAKSLEIAKKYYRLAGVSHKVDVRHALAVETLKSLILNGEACSYDFVFVDADKRMYHEYFELLLQLVRIGGIIVFDNVLWHGKVADTLVNDPKTVCIRNFNKSIMEDERVSISMRPLCNKVLSLELVVWFENDEHQKDHHFDDALSLCNELSEIPSIEVKVRYKHLSLYLDYVELNAVVAWCVR